MIEFIIHALFCNLISPSVFLMKRLHAAQLHAVYLWRHDIWSRRNPKWAISSRHVSHDSMWKFFWMHVCACTHAVIHLTLISTCQITRTTSAQSYFSLDTRTYNRNTLYCLFIYFIFSSAACLQRFHRILYGGRHYLCIWLFGQLFIYWIINSSSWLTIPLFMI